MCLDVWSFTTQILGCRALAQRDQKRDTSVGNLGYNIILKKKSISSKLEVKIYFLKALIVFL